MALVATECVRVYPFTHRGSFVHPTCRYPSRGSGCPDASQAVNPEAEDETYMYGSARNYYFPDYAVNNCGYGCNYPM